MTNSNSRDAIHAESDLSILSIKYLKLLFNRFEIKNKMFTLDVCAVSTHNSTNCTPICLKDKQKNR